MRKTLKLTDLRNSTRHPWKSESLERWWINFEVLEGFKFTTDGFLMTIFVTLIIHRPEINFSLSLHTLGTFYYLVDYRIIFAPCKMLDRSAAFRSNYWSGICKTFVVGANSKLLYACSVLD